MPEYNLPHFGQVPTGNLEEYYHAEIEFNGGKVQIDLNFENKTIDVVKLDKIKGFIENIVEFDKLNKAYILDDYEEGETVKLYAEHHIEEIGNDGLSTFINFDDTSITPEKQVIAKLKLVRVGLYPENDDNFAIFDYSIGREITDYLIVINTDENGQLDYLTMES